MASLQEQYDNAMFDFSTGDYDGAISKLRSMLAEEAMHFDAQLALGMAYFRKGDYATAIAEGHKAEKLRPAEQLVHTNLSLFYMKAGEKSLAEHHGGQARIASWKSDPAGAQPGGAAPKQDPELAMAKPKPPPALPPEQFPAMPWKKKPG
jgi:predicted Zn-dependent protease